MAHDITIIINGKNCILAKAAQLGGYAVDLHDKLPNLSGKELEAAHDALERTENFLTVLCAGTSMPSGLTFDTLIAEMEERLGI